MSSIIQDRFLYACIFICFLLHLISAYFTIGFYSDDEHFQILEITAYLLSINEMAVGDKTGFYWEWESHVRMRPWLQPLLYFGFINFFQYLGFNDPFTWTLIIRILSSLLGLFSIIFFYFTFRDYFFQKNYKFNILLIFTFWFYPFLHSRTSSENIGITIYIFSFCILFKLINAEKNIINITKIISASYLFGISMVIKFTLVFTTVPFFLWIALFRFNINFLLFFCSAIFLALATGILIDSFFWGEFTNTYYQFYKYNLTKEFGNLNNFGTNPWYYYLIEIAKQLAPLLSIVFLIGIIIYWIKKPLNIFTWITLSTFIIFSLIGHKEIRYIFPIYIFAPFFIGYALDFIKNKNILNILKTLLIFSNIIFLSLTLFFPPNSKIGVYKFIYKNIGLKDEIYYLNEDPYQINNMNPYFYTYFLPKIKKFNENKIKGDNIWLVTNNFKDIDNLQKSDCKTMYTSYPKSITNLNKNWKRLKINWYIFKCG